MKLSDLLQDMKITDTCKTTAGALAPAVVLGDAPIENENYEVVLGSTDVEINDICFDSRNIKPKDVFVCLSGVRNDGHEYIPAAVLAKAAAIVIEKDLDAVISELEKKDAANINLKTSLENGNITVIRVKDTRFALSYMSAAYFGYPARKLTTIGITGTKGKTTTSYMVYSALTNAGIKTGLIGTINIIIGATVIESSNTTPISYMVEKYFNDMVNQGCKCVVMEVSSQGLMQYRVGGILFDFGVFTNIEPDHIGPGEHKDFEEYMHCKGRLFKNCRIGIVNGDDSHVNEVLEGHTCEIETFGIDEKNDLSAANILLHSLDGTLSVHYTLKEKKKSGKYPMDFKVAVNIPGRFSVYNSLTAIAILRHLDIKPEVICSSLLKVSVRGRIQMVGVSKNFSVMVDYAHNAMSLKTLLTTLREYNPKRLVCLFGCGGNRSRDRRFEMGEISSRLSDLTVVTTDNPRFEKPEAIMDDIVTGVRRADGKYEVIEDRREAIRYCLENARRGDLIVIAGKGHEDYQEIQGVKYHMDDVEIINEEADKLKKEGKLAYFSMPIEDVAAASDGKIINKCGDVEIDSVSTDSRSGNKSTLFVPIKGEKNDGHDFMQGAFDSGMKAAFTSKDDEENRKIVKNVPEMALIQTKDNLRAMQKLASYVRGKFDGRLIGVTGSVGKTTTKELVAAALSQSLSVFKTSQNHNSQIGVSRMMLDMLKEPFSAAVIEMGMSLKGEMARLSDIAKPDCAVFTNIGVSHIGQLHTKENIRKEKLCIINNFKDNGLLVLNNDDVLLAELARLKKTDMEFDESIMYHETFEKFKKTDIVTYGTKDGSDFKAADIKLLPDGSEFNIELPDAEGKVHVKLNVPGLHNVLNAAAAMAVAVRLNVSPKLAAKGLSLMKPQAMRGSIISKDGITYIDDSYNASPDSVKSGINVLISQKAERKFAVLGDILELGDLSENLHRGIGDYIAEIADANGNNGKFVLVTVGHEAAYIANQAELKNGSVDTHSFAFCINGTKEEQMESRKKAVDFLKSELKPGDAVLFKGSRGMKMDELLKAVME